MCHCIGVFANAVSSPRKLVVGSHGVTEDGHSVAPDFVRTPVFQNKILTLTYGANEACKATFCPPAENRSMPKTLRFLAAAMRYNRRSGTNHAHGTDGLSDAWQRVTLERG